MSQYSIPLQNLPNQRVDVVINGYSFRIVLYQTQYGMFMDLYVNSTPIRYGMACQNLNKIIRDRYLGIIGDFFFNDTEGTSDPVYTGLEDRFVLYFDDAI